MRTTSQLHGNGYAGRFDVTGLTAFGGDQRASLAWLERGATRRQDFEVQVLNNRQQGFTVTANRSAIRDERDI
jgi:hypothetical protein